MNSHIFLISMNKLPETMSAQYDQITSITKTNKKTKYEYRRWGGVVIIKGDSSVESNGLLWSAHSHRD